MAVIATWSKPTRYIQASIKGSKRGRRFLKPFWKKKKEKAASPAEEAVENAKTESPNDQTKPEDGVAKTESKSTDLESNVSNKERSSKESLSSDKSRERNPRERERNSEDLREDDLKEKTRSSREQNPRARERNSEDPRDSYFLKEKPRSSREPRHSGNTIQETKSLEYISAEHNNIARGPMRQEPLDGAHVYSNYAPDGEEQDDQHKHGGFWDFWNWFGYGQNRDFGVTNQRDVPNFTPTTYPSPCPSPSHRPYSSPCCCPPECPPCMPCPPYAMPYIYLPMPPPNWQPQNRTRGPQNGSPPYSDPSATSGSSKSKQRSRRFEGDGYRESNQQERYQDTSDMRPQDKSGIRPQMCVLCDCRTPQSRRWQDNQSQDLTLCRSCRKQQQRRQTLKNEDNFPPPRPPTYPLWPPPPILHAPENAQTTKCCCKSKMTERDPNKCKRKNRCSSIDKGDSCQCNTSQRPKAGLIKARKIQSIRIFLPGKEKCLAGSPSVNTSLPCQEIWCMKQELTSNVCEKRPKQTQTRAVCFESVPCGQIKGLRRMAECVESRTQSCPSTLYSRCRSRKHGARRYRTNREVCAPNSEECTYGSNGRGYVDCIEKPLAEEQPIVCRCKCCCELGKNKTKRCKKRTGENSCLTESICDSRKNVRCENNVNGVVCCCDGSKCICCVQSNPACPSTEDENAECLSNSTSSSEDACYTKPSPCAYNRPFWCSKKPRPYPDKTPVPNINFTLQFKSDESSSSSDSSDSQCEYGCQRECEYECEYECREIGSNLNNKQALPLALRRGDQSLVKERLQDNEEGGLVTYNDDVMNCHSQGSSEHIEQSDDFFHKSVCRDILNCNHKHLLGCGKSTVRNNIGGCLTNEVTSKRSLLYFEDSSQFLDINSDDKIWSESLLQSTHEYHSNVSGWDEWSHGHAFTEQSCVGLKDTFFKSLYDNWHESSPCSEQELENLIGTSAHPNSPPLSPKDTPSEIKPSATYTHLPTDLCPSRFNNESGNKNVSDSENHCANSKVEKIEDTKDLTETDVGDSSLIYDSMSLSDGNWEEAHQPAPQSIYFESPVNAHGEIIINPGDEINDDNNQQESIYCEANLTCPCDCGETESSSTCLGSEQESTCVSSESSDICIPLRERQSKADCSGKESGKGTQIDHKKQTSSVHHSSSTSLRNDNSTSKKACVTEKQRPPLRVSSSTSSNDGMSSKCSERNLHSNKSCIKHKQRPPLGNSSSVSSRHSIASPTQNGNNAKRKQKYPEKESAPTHHSSGKCRQTSPGQCPSNTFSGKRKRLHCPSSPSSNGSVENHKQRSPLRNTSSTSMCQCEISNSQEKISSTKTDATRKYNSPHQQRSFQSPNKQTSNQRLPLRNSSSTSNCRNKGSKSEQKQRPPLRVSSSTSSNDGMSSKCSERNLLSNKLCIKHKQRPPLGNSSSVSSRHSIASPTQNGNNAKRKQKYPEKESAPTHHSSGKCRQTSPGQCPSNTFSGKRKRLHCPSSPSSNESVANHKQRLPLRNSSSTSNCRSKTCRTPENIRENGMCLNHRIPEPKSPSTSSSCNRHFHRPGKCREPSPGQCSLNTLSGRRMRLQCQSNSSLSDLSETHKPRSPLRNTSVRSICQGNSTQSQRSPCPYISDSKPIKNQSQHDCEQNSACDSKICECHIKSCSIENGAKRRHSIAYKRSCVMPDQQIAAFPRNIPSITSVTKEKNQRPHQKSSSASISLGKPVQSQGKLIASNSCVRQTNAFSKQCSPLTSTQQSPRRRYSPVSFCYRNTSPAEINDHSYVSRASNRHCTEVPVQNSSSQTTCYGSYLQNQGHPAKDRKGVNDLRNYPVRDSGSISEFSNPNQRMRLNKEQTHQDKPMHYEGYGENIQRFFKDVCKTEEHSSRYQLWTPDGKREDAELNNHMQIPDYPNEHAKSFNDCPHKLKERCQEDYLNDCRQSSSPIVIGTRSSEEILGGNCTPGNENPTKENRTDVCDKSSPNTPGSNCSKTTTRLKAYRRYKTDKCQKSKCPQRGRETCQSQRPCLLRHHLPHKENADQEDEAEEEEGTCDKTLPDNRECDESCPDEQPAGDISCDVKEESIQEPKHDNAWCDKWVDDEDGVPCWAECKDTIAHKGGVIKYDCIRNADGGIRCYIGRGDRYYYQEQVENGGDVVLCYKVGEDETFYDELETGTPNRDLETMGDKYSKYRDIKIPCIIKQRMSSCCETVKNADGCDKNKFPGLETTNTFTGIICNPESKKIERNCVMGDDNVTCMFDPDNGRLYLETEKTNEIRPNDDAKENPNNIKQDTCNDGSEKMNDENEDETEFTDGRRQVEEDLCNDQSLEVPFTDQKLPSASTDQSPHCKPSSISVCYGSGHRCPHQTFPNRKKLSAKKKVCTQRKYSVSGKRPPLTSSQQQSPCRKSSSTSICYGSTQQAELRPRSNKSHTRLGHFSKDPVKNSSSHTFCLGPSFQSPSVVADMGLTDDDALWKCQVQDSDIVNRFSKTDQRMQSVVDAHPSKALVYEGYVKDVQRIFQNGCKTEERSTRYQFWTPTGHTTIPDNPKEYIRQHNGCYNDSKDSRKVMCQEDPLKHCRPILSGNDIGAPRREMIMKDDCAIGKQNLSKENRAEVCNTSALKCSPRKCNTTRPKYNPCKRYRQGKCRGSACPKRGTQSCQNHGPCILQRHKNSVGDLETSCIVREKEKECEISRANKRNKCDVNVSEDEWDWCVEHCEDAFWCETDKGGDNRHCYSTGKRDMGCQKNKRAVFTCIKDEKNTHRLESAKTKKRNKRCREYVKNTADGCLEKTNVKAKSHEDLEEYQYRTKQRYQENDNVKVGFEFPCILNERDGHVSEAGKDFPCNERNPDVLNDEEEQRNIMKCLSSNVDETDVSKKDTVSKIPCDMTEKKQDKSYSDESKKKKDECDKNKEDDLCAVDWKCSIAYEAGKINGDSIKCRDREFRCFKEHGDRFCCQSPTSNDGDVLSRGKEKESDIAHDHIDINTPRPNLEAIVDERGKCSDSTSPCMVEHKGAPWWQTAKVGDQRGKSEYTEFPGVENRTCGVVSDWESVEIERKQYSAGSENAIGKRLGDPVKSRLYRGTGQTKEIFQNDDNREISSYADKQARCNVLNNKDYANKGLKLPCVESKEIEVRLEMEKHMTECRRNIYTGSSFGMDQDDILLCERENNESDCKYGIDSKDSCSKNKGRMLYYTQQKETGTQKDKIDSKGPFTTEEQRMFCFDQLKNEYMRNEQRQMESPCINGNERILRSYNQKEGDIRKKIGNSDGPLFPENERGFCYERLNEPDMHRKQIHSGFQYLNEKEREYSFDKPKEREGCTDRGVSGLPRLSEKEMIFSHAKQTEEEFGAYGVPCQADNDHMISCYGQQEEEVLRMNQMNCFLPGIAEKGTGLGFGQRKEEDVNEDGKVSKVPCLAEKRAIIGYGMQEEELLCEEQINFDVPRLIDKGRVFCCVQRRDEGIRKEQTAPKRPCTEETVRMFAYDQGNEEEMNREYKESGDTLFPFSAQTDRMGCYNSIRDENEDVLLGENYREMSSFPEDEIMSFCYNYNPCQENDVEVDHRGVEVSCLPEQKRFFRYDGPCYKREMHREEKVLCEEHGYSDVSRCAEQERILCRDPCRKREMCKQQRESDIPCFADQKYIICPDPCKEKGAMRKGQVGSEFLCHVKQTDVGWNDPCEDKDACEGERDPNVCLFGEQKEMKCYYPCKKKVVSKGRDDSDFLCFVKQKGESCNDPYKENYACKDQINTKVSCFKEHKCHTPSKKKFVCEEQDDESEVPYYNEKKVMDCCDKLCKKIVVCDEQQYESDVPCYEEKKIMDCCDCQNPCKKKVVCKEEQSELDVPCYKEKKGMDCCDRLCKKKFVCKEQQDESDISCYKEKKGMDCCNKLCKKKFVCKEQQNESECPCYAGNKDKKVMDCCDCQNPCKKKLVCKEQQDESDVSCYKEKKGMDCCDCQNPCKKKVVCKEQQSESNGPCYKEKKGMDCCNRLCQKKFECKEEQSESDVSCYKEKKVMDCCDCQNPCKKKLVCKEQQDESDISCYKEKKGLDCCSRLCKKEVVCKEQDEESEVPCLAKRKKICCCAKSYSKYDTLTEESDDNAVPIGDNAPHCCRVSCRCRAVCKNHRNENIRCACCRKERTGRRKKNINGKCVTTSNGETCCMEMKSRHRHRRISKCSQCSDVCECDPSSDTDSDWCAQRKRKVRLPKVCIKNDRMCDVARICCAIQTDPQISKQCSTDPPIPKQCFADSLISKECSTDPPSSMQCSLEIPISKQCSTDPPVSKQCFTDPPISKQCSTDPPASKQCSTDPPISKQCSTDPPVSKQCSTDPMISKQCSTDPMISKQCSTDPMISKQCSTDPMISKQCSTDFSDAKNGNVRKKRLLSGHFRRRRRMVLELEKQFFNQSVDMLTTERSLLLGEVIPTTHSPKYHFTFQKDPCIAHSNSKSDGRSLRHSIHHSCHSNVTSNADKLSGENMVTSSCGYGYQKVKIDSSGPQVGRKSLNQDPLPCSCMPRCKDSRYAKSQPSSSTEISPGGSSKPSRPSYSYSYAKDHCQSLENGRSPKAISRRGRALFDSARHNQLQMRLKVLAASRKISKTKMMQYVKSYITNLRSG